MTEETKMPIVPVVTGEVFLQDEVVDDQHCYICKKEIDKFDTKDAALLRINKGKMGFCCTNHHGIVQEFVKQFNRLPYGWEEHADKVKDISDGADPKPVVNKYRDRSRKSRKAPKRRS